jgi:hypothetical protein
MRREDVTSSSEVKAFIGRLTFGMVDIATDARELQ